MKKYKKKVWFGLASSAPFAGLAFFCKYVVPGYSFTAFVCMGIIGVILFYTFIPMLGEYHPGLARGVTWAVSICLCIGLLLFAVTESFILHAGLGSSETTSKYLLVLGAKVRPDGPSVSLWDRIYAAADYLQNHPDVIVIVSGGQGDDEVMSEADCMFDELVKLGIAPERIWKEEHATSTDENIRFSLELIEQNTGTRPDTLTILSSEYHLLRASLMARKQSIQFEGVPAKTSRLSQRINHSMREVAGVWHFLLLGN